MGRGASGARAPRGVLAALAASCQIALLGLPSPAAGQEGSPEVENFRLTPSTFCYGDRVRYAFSYRNFPAGGLAAVKDARVVADWRRAGERPTVMWRLAPRRDELALHPARDGTFASGVRYWRQEGAPAGGVDLRLSLTLTLGDGREVASSATGRYAARSCPPVTPLTTLTGGPTGRIGFETATPTTRQFLTGAKDAPRAVIWGDLGLPRSGAGRVPAVILIHGSEGVGPREVRWAEELAEIGVAAFIVDSTTGRGLKNVTSDLSSGAMIVDVYRALGLLATHPRIDPSRIALMGGSRGCVVSLFASLTRFRRMHGPAGVEFAAYLPFYPGCVVDHIGGDQVSDRPIRIFHGQADDWTPVGPCREYAERLRRAGKDVQITEYPGAHHAFDDPSLPPAQFRPEVVNPSRCFFVELPGGRVVNRATGQPLDFDDPCFSDGATTGYDPVAHRQAIRAVKEFLAATFGLRR